MVILWPGEKAKGHPPTRNNIEAATVTAVRGQAACAAQEGPGCQLVQFKITGDSAHSGQRDSLLLSGIDAAPRVSKGDKIRVRRTLQDGPTPGSPAAQFLTGNRYAFIDFDRRQPLLVLSLLFVALVLVLGRSHGLRALLGLGASIVVLLLFVVPAIFAGESPLLVAVVGSFAVMLLTIGISHGLGVKSAGAMLGTGASLIVTALLAWIAVRSVHLTGTSTIEAAQLRGAGGGISLEGVVLAGMVVGGLGVLDDVTVSQSSIVLALHKTDPDMPSRRLIGHAIEVGRDHFGATVNTLALAYAGVALPLLLVFQAQAVPAGDALNREGVASAIAAAIVGSIGLLLAVPLTTVITAALARAVPADQLPDEHHHHH